MPDTEKDPSIPTMPIIETKFCWTEGQPYWQWELNFIYEGVFRHSNGVDHTVTVTAQIMGTKHNVSDPNIDRKEEVTIKATSPREKVKVVGLKNMWAEGTLIWLNADKIDQEPIIVYSGTWQGPGANMGPESAVVINQHTTMMPNLPASRFGWTQGHPYWQWWLSFEAKWTQKDGSNREMSITASIDGTKHNKKFKGQNSRHVVDISAKSPKEKFEIKEIGGMHADGELTWINANQEDQDPIVIFSGRWQGPGANSGPTNVIVINKAL